MFPPPPPRTPTWTLCCARKDCLIPSLWSDDPPPFNPLIAPLRLKWLTDFLAIYLKFKPWGKWNQIYSRETAIKVVQSYIHYELVIIFYTKTGRKWGKPFQGRKHNAKNIFLSSKKEIKLHNLSIHSRIHIFLRYNFLSLKEKSDKLLGLCSK